MSAKIKNRRSARHRQSHRPKGINKHAFDNVYWPYIPLLAIISLLAVLGIKTGALTHGWQKPGSAVLAYSVSMEPQKLLADTNSQRQQNQQAGLLLDDKLSAAAQAKANDMATRDYWSHKTPDGSPPWIFFSAKNYQYQKAGENLAAGFDTEQSVVNAWMASVSHRHNLLDPAYKDVGFGVANIANYKAVGGGPMTVVVAFYGTPQGSVDTPTTLNSNVAGYSSSNSSNSEAKGAGLKTSRAQIGLAGFGLYSLGSAVILMLMGAALAIWVSRHLLLLRRVLVKGESLVFHHPLFDVGLLVMAALAFLVNQTAGLIR